MGAAVLSAFAAGLASFLSPCVLPLVPVYLAQLVGPMVWQAQTGAAVVEANGRGGGAAGMQLAAWARATMVLHAAAFVAGFGLVFMALGATASALGALLSAHQEAIRRVAGVALVLFGLHVAGVIHVPGLERERRWHLRVGAPGYLTALGLGAAFGLGWTPCVGPYLGGVLALAAQTRTLREGVALLAVYAAGLGLPFLLAGAACDRLMPALRRLAPYTRAIEMVGGALLVVLGVAIFFNWLIIINSKVIMMR
jgi:cytochrome c-type biogenesis protein